jgi:hypothetical protein
MWNRVVRGMMTWRRLMVAVLLSILVHLWLIGGFEGWLHFDKDQEQPLLQVTLTPPPAIPKPAQPEKKSRSIPRKMAAPVPRVPAVAEQSQVPSAPSISTQEHVASADAIPSETTALSSSPEPQVEASATVPEEEPTPQVPSQVNIEYQVLRGGSVYGVEHHRFEIHPDGTYVLTSLAEAKGLLSLALSDLVQRSEGQVTPHGLRPQHYLYQYGKNPDKAQKATFDWEGKTLLMEVGAKKQNVELQEGVQDLMSFMYQFMFVPPLQEMQLAITNGKKLKVYNYAFEGEETLDTRMGAIRTWRIGKNNSDGDEKTELWLAADDHYLPVKISKTEKDGTVTERVATSLNIQP